MFKNLLLEEDSDDSFSGGQEDVDIQVSISDFDSPKVKIQEVGLRVSDANKIKIQKIKDQITVIKEKLKLLSYNKLQNESKISELSWKESQLNLQLQEAVQKAGDEILKLFVGGIGATLVFNHAKAQSKTILKCPSHKEVKRVENKLQKAEKEYKAIENKTKADVDEYNQKIQSLNQIKENYQYCQRENLYK